MTNRLFQLSLLGLILIAAAGAYTVSRNVEPGRGKVLDCTRDWLTLSTSQCEKIRQDDPNFQEEAQFLKQSLQDHQQRLVDLVASPKTSEDLIRTQAQAVLDARHALMRRTVNHLLAIRRHMDVQQCMRLNHLCTETIGLPGVESGRGLGRGRGPGRQGMGRARGQRHQYNQLAPALALTQTQQETVARIDPNYSSDAVILTQQVRSAHLTLKQALGDPNTSDSVVVQDLENLITIRTELEQRTVDYVLTLRPTLSSTQQQRLIGLSQRGRRWRGGRLERNDLR